MSEPALSVTRKHLLKHHEGEPFRKNKPENGTNSYLGDNGKCICKYF